MKQTVSANWFLFSESGFSSVKYMPEKKLENLLAGIIVSDSLGSRDREICHVAYDSRDAKPGGLFVAIPGEKQDGGDFIGEALGKGAETFISQSPLDSLAGLNLDPKNVTALCVEDSRQALSRVSANFYGNPSECLRLTGITGTNGKTTLTYILEALSKAHGRETGVIGTIDCHFGKTKIPSAVTTPQSLDLNRMLRQMTDEGISDCFLEVSSHALAQKRVYNMNFDVGIFTNISRDHLDFHEGIEEYKNAKKNLFRENNVTTRIFNIDDPVGKELATEFSENIFTTGIDGLAEFSAENIVLKASGSQFILKTPSGSIPIRTNLLGKHNVCNLLSASAFASAQGISLETVQNVFQKIQTIPGRLEPVNCGQNFLVLIDYAHTDDALSKAIAAAKAFTEGKIIVVFGCGGDRDKGKRREMGRVAIEGADFTVITSDNPRTEDPEQIVEDIREGISGAFTKEVSYTTITNRRDAIEYAINRAEKNDLVLIAGKGHEDYQITGTHKEPFDDREVAKEFLRNRAH